MNILICDLWPEECHRPINMAFIHALAKCNEVITIISVNDYYKNELNEFSKMGISHIDIYEKVRKDQVGRRLYCYNLQRKTKDILIAGKYDIVFCLAYRTEVLPLSKNLTKIAPMILCEHSNLDHLQIGLIRCIAKRMMQRTYHVVFEEIFKDWMISTININKENIFVVTHPITIDSVADIEIDDNCLKYDCIGLCHANDDSFIQNIVDNHIKYEDSNLKLVMRSKKVVSSSESIIIVKDYLEKEEYRRYFRETKSVFVATPKSYKNRLSASINDAVAFNKKVYTTNITLSSIYEAKYPGVCVYISSEEDLLKKLINSKNEYIKTYEEFEKFKRDHSQMMMDKQVYEAVQNIKEKVSYEQK